MPNYDNLQKKAQENRIHMFCTEVTKQNHLMAQEFIKILGKIHEKIKSYENDVEIANSVLECEKMSSDQMDTIENKKQLQKIET